MSLRSTPVSRSLDRKLTIAGFEIPDLFVIFMLLMLLQYMFANYEFGIFLTIIPPVILGLVIRYFRRGQPDNYMKHWLRSKLQPKHLCAFTTVRRKPFLSKIGDHHAK